MATRSLVVGALLLLSVQGAFAAGNSAGAPKKGKRSAPEMEMVHVKGGCYRMGESSVGGPEEKPVHEVCVDDFHIGKYEVTQAQWKDVMGSNPSSNKACGGDCPVDNVSWNDAQQFIGRLNGMSSGAGKGGYRLPTEAEWEYAARSGGGSERYAGGDEVAAVGWYDDNSDEVRAGGDKVDGAFGMHPVGGRAANALGIHDMSGNVWEWTNDWYAGDYYKASPRKNPAGPATGTLRVLRGGSFGDSPFDLRASYRNYLPPDYRGTGKGLRLVRTAAGK